MTICLRATHPIDSCLTATSLQIKVSISIGLVGVVTVYSYYGMLKFRHQNTSSLREENTAMQDVRDRAQEFLQDIGDSFSMRMSRDDMKSPRFWKAVLAELIGSMILVLFGCGSWIETDVEEHPMTVRISITFGLVYAVMLYTIRPVSGGHINPTVTVAMVVTRQISLARATFYCLAQVLGGIIGAALLLSFTPAVYMYRDLLGCTNIANEMSAGQGFGIELLISFFYVFVVFSCYAKVDKAEMIVYNLFTPFVIGFTAISIHLFAIPFTGASFNPARSFGPSVVTGKWDNHWIYWFGPIIGGTLGGVLQQTAFGRKATLSHLKTCMVTHEIDGSNDKLATVTATSPLPKKPQVQAEVIQSHSNKLPSSEASSLKKYGTRMEEVSNETQSQSSFASFGKKGSRSLGSKPEIPHDTRSQTSSSSSAKYSRSHSSRPEISFRSNKVSDSSLPSLTVPFPLDIKTSEDPIYAKPFSSGPEVTIHADNISKKTSPLTSTNAIGESDGILAQAFMESEKEDSKILENKLSPEETTKRNDLKLQNNQGFAHAGVQTIGSSRIESKDLDANSDLTIVTPLQSHMASFEEDEESLSASSGDDNDNEDVAENRTWQEQSSVDGMTNRLFIEGDESPLKLQTEPESDKDGSQV